MPLHVANQPPELPQPHVPEAINNVLDLTKHLGDFTVTVANWAPPHIWLNLVGRNSSGEKIITILDNQEISTVQFEQGLIETLPRDELMTLTHDSDVTLRCFISHDGSSDASTARAFPELPLTIKTRDEYLDDLTDFNDKDFGEWEVGPGGKHFSFGQIHDIPGYHLRLNIIESSPTNIILEKTFPIIPGRLYQLTLSAKEIKNGDSTPHRLILRMGNTPPDTYVINTPHWSGVTSTFTPTSETMTVRLEHPAATGQNSYYAIDSLRVRIR